MSASASTMRAVVLVGPTSSVEVSNAYPRPTFDAASDDLLITVKAVATNPVDSKLKWINGAKPEEAVLTGFDAAGIVKEVGSKANGFKIGDEVFLCGSIHRGHTFAEEVVVASNSVALKPKSLSFFQAAAFAIVSKTVYPALYTRLRIQDHVGEWIYIHSGSGGVGSIAIQLAKAAGLRVLSSAGRPESREWATKMGAEHVLDYTRDLKAQMDALQIAPVKLMLNAYTDSALESILPLLAMDGHVISVNPGVNSSGGLAPLSGAAVQQLFMKNATLGWLRDLSPNAGDILRFVAKLADEGKLQPISGYPGQSFKGFQGIVQALQLQDAGKAIGKIVVDLQ